MFLLKQNNIKKKQVEKTQLEFKAINNKKYKTKAI